MDSPQQGDLDFEAAAETEFIRSLLDHLIAESGLYKQGSAYQGLLDFVVQLRQFAPFNAMLLQVQKPGLSYAASAKDWKIRFERRPRDKARPLLILHPFGPVALVYDVQDTEGKDLPESAFSFPASGSLANSELERYVARLIRRGIECEHFDGGDQSAGQIELIAKGTAEKPGRYKMLINRNHPTTTRFVTLCHELGHLFLGHLGSDKKRSIPNRRGLGHSQCELEAESVAYLVSVRQGITPASQSYLAEYVGKEQNDNQLDVYQIMRAAGQTEIELGIAAQRKAMFHSNRQ